MRRVVNSNRTTSLDVVTGDPITGICRYHAPLYRLHKMPESSADIVAWLGISLGMLDNPYVHALVRYSNNLMGSLAAVYLSPTQACISIIDVPLCPL